MRNRTRTYPRVDLPPVRNEKIDLEDLFSRVADLGSIDGPKKAKKEYNFVYETHDGALVITKQKFTHKEFERFVDEVNIENWEPVEFTGTLRL